MRIIGLAGWSGSGKTTLLAKVIPRIASRGLKVSTVKHAHHSFDVSFLRRRSAGEGLAHPPHGRRDRGAGELG
jgi:molybdopterin-guanine dinucleotide biosynthesis protein MobB